MWVWLSWWIWWVRSPDSGGSFGSGGPSGFGGSGESCGSRVGLDVSALLGRSGLSRVPSLAIFGYCLSI